MACHDTLYIVCWELAWMVERTRQMEVRWAEGGWLGVSLEYDTIFNQPAIGFEEGEGVPLRGERAVA